MDKLYRMLLIKNGLNPFFNVIDHDRDDYLIVHNWLTGKYRMLEK